MKALRCLQFVTVVATKELTLPSQPKDLEDLFKERFNIGYLRENAMRLLLGRTLPAAEPQTLVAHHFERRVASWQLREVVQSQGIEIVASMLTLVEQQKDGFASLQDILISDGHSNLALVRIEIEKPFAMGSGVMTLDSILDLYWNPEKCYWVIDDCPYGEWSNGHRFFSYKLS